MNWIRSSSFTANYRKEALKCAFIKELNTFKSFSFEKNIRTPPLNGIEMFLSVFSMITKSDYRWRQESTRGFAFPIQFDFVSIGIGFNFSWLIAFLYSKAIERPRNELSLHCCALKWSYFGKGQQPNVSMI